jgi:hypothetical protein
MVGFFFAGEEMRFSFPCPKDDVDEAGPGNFETGGGFFFAGADFLPSVAGAGTTG